MIPKIIHYCWLSTDSYPENILKCMDSWKKHLPDYEIRLWNLDRFNLSQSIWVQEAFESHKYAFAADYIRLYALYHYGGIYLDSDVEVIKPFDELLHLPYFIGQENTPFGVEAATIGCEKGFHLIGEMLRRYENRHFIKDNGEMDCTPLPCIFRACIDSLYEYHPITRIDDFTTDNIKINIFPVDWFSPKTWDTQVLKTTDNTYSIHHFSASWTKSEDGKKGEQIVYTRPSLIRRGKSLIKRMVRKGTLNNCLFANFFFGVYKKKQFPLMEGCVVYREDYSRLRRLKKPIKKHRLSFITMKESLRNPSDFYPIAKLEGTEIEFHFVSCYTKKDAEQMFRDA